MMTAQLCIEAPDTDPLPLPQPLAAAIGLIQLFRTLVWGSNGQTLIDNCEVFGFFNTDIYSNGTSGTMAQ